MSTNINLGGSVLLNGVMPVFPTTGNVFFVQSVSANAADDPSHGSRPGRPFATLNYAITKCTANMGDQIYVMPGHVETVSTAGGLTVGTAGVSIIGLGHGSKKPLVNITGTAATVAITAADTFIRNVMFTTTVDAVVSPIVISAADCSLFNIETRDTSATQATDYITTTAAADRLRMVNWIHRGDAAAGAATALKIVGGDGIIIEDFWIDGNFSTACIQNVTTACTNITIAGTTRQSYARSRNAACVIVTMVSTSTGNIGPCINMRLLTDGANVTEALVGAAMQFFSPLLIVNANGEQGLTWNGAVTADL